MVAPVDKIGNYESKQAYSKWLIAFSIGGFSNLLPFLNYDYITILQWAFVGINTASIGVATMIYIYCWFKINQIRDGVISAG
jgi:hypothetical protein